MSDFETFMRRNSNKTTAKTKGISWKIRRKAVYHHDPAGLIVLDVNNPRWERRPKMNTHAVLIMGESRVGKSSIIARYCYGLFPYFYDPGWDRDSKEVTIDNELHKIELEDFSTYITPDQPFDLRDRVIQTAEGFVLVYDVTSKASFDTIKAIHAEVRRKGRPSRPVVIVGNKSDDADEREVTESSGRKLARDLRARFAEVSARTGTGLDELFLELATTINNVKKREARLTSNVNCKNLGRALVAALVKLSAGMEKMHWKILYWMYGPDRPLRVQPMVRPVSREVQVATVTSVSTTGSKTGILLARKPHARGVGRTNMQYSSDLMTGGLEITVAEPSSVNALVHQST